MNKIQESLKGYDIEIKKLGLRLIVVNVKFKDNIVMFNLPDDLKNYLNTFIVYRDEVVIYLNKEVLG